MSLGLVLLLMYLCIWPYWRALERDIEWLAEEERRLHECVAHMPAREQGDG